MSYGEITLDQNAKALESVNGNSSGAHIDEVERQALAEVTTLQSEKGRVAGASHGAGLGSGETEGSLIVGALADQAIPGLKVLTTIGDYMSDRNSDMGAHGLSAKDRGTARTMEEMIGDAKRPAGSYGAAEGIVPRMKNVAKFLSNDADTDKLAGGLVGGLGKKNAMHIPADESTAAGLTKSRENIFGKKLANTKTLDSVYAARMERSAAIGLAKMKAPGMDMGFAPAAPTQAILHEAEEHAKTVAGTLV